MSLHLNVLPRRNSVGSRRARSTRYSFAVEGLEVRALLSGVAATMPPAHVEHLDHPGNHARSDQHGPKGPHTPDRGGSQVAPNAADLKIASVVVNNVALIGNQLVANTNVSGTVAGEAFSTLVPVPLTLTAAPAVGSNAQVASSAMHSNALMAAATTAPAPVQVLHLSLGPINLSLLGLNIHLGASCAFNSKAPITATIEAIPNGATYTSPITGQTYQGGALGDLLSGVANLLNGGGSLGSLGSTLTTLEGGLTNILNNLLTPASGVTGGTFGGAGATTAAAGPTPGSSEVLMLPLGPIALDVLGAFVGTSPICLNVTATPGPGNLLGNLLG